MFKIESDALTNSIQFLFGHSRMREANSENNKVRDRIESKRHKIKKTNQNTSPLPRNVIPFPVQPNKEKIFNLCEDLFCEPSEGKEA